MTERTLWDVLRDEAPPAAPKPASIDDQFAAFLDANPWILDEVTDRCRALKARGVHHYGIAAIVEAIRYDRTLAMGEDGSGFRINNNVNSRLARKVMADAPDLAGFFELRQLRAA